MEGKELQSKLIECCAIKKENLAEVLQAAVRAAETEHLVKQLFCQIL